MIQRRTQTESFWQEEFDFSNEDISYVYDLILDNGKPMSTAALAQAVMERYVRREEEANRAELSRGRLYQPKDSFEIGEKLIFPALDFASGTVVGTRRGNNPEYGEISVIRMEMSAGRSVREFAADLDGDHVLNRSEAEQDLLASAAVLSMPELYERYGSAVGGKLAAALADRTDVIQFKTDWFLRDLLAPIGPGHLNIAEALIEINGRPLPTTELLPDLDLPAEISEPIKILSLNRSLEGDKRFDNVGDSGRDIWYLRRLAPETVANPPRRLVVVVDPYNRADIAPELVLIEREIDDEGSGQEVLGPTRQIYKSTIALPYPHWRFGTLPLTARTRGLFPQAETHHTPVVLVDGQSGKKMQGWVVHESLFVYGLEGWYRQHQLPVGARIKLERTRDPRVITVDFIPQRLQSLWLRIATAQGGKLVFQMRKGPVSCEFDDLLAINEDKNAGIDGLWAKVHTSGDGLLQVMLRIVPELIKLSPQGTVHAKTIYTAVNFLKRVPPGPIFALLSTEPCFVSMGGGYWTFDATLQGSG